jgi:hypothetical protein
LKDLGVGIVGHRRKLTPSLLCALSRSQKRRQPRQNPPPSQLSQQPADAAGERRYLTVMFCDLVD